MALLRLRKRVAFERFLARLAASGRGDDEEAATEHLNAATGIDLGDFFDFEVRRTPALDAAAGLGGASFRREFAGVR